MKSKNLFRTISILILSVVMVFSFAACGEPEDKNNKTDVKPYEIVSNPNSKHIKNAKDVEDDRYLLKDGVSDYTVVLAEKEKSNADIAKAKEELLYFFKEATGFSLSTSYDVKEDGTQLEHASNNKYISLGETTLFETSGITDDEYAKETLIGEGCRIITKDNTIYILGQNGRGVLNGVYSFLELYFHFEFYERTCWDIDTGLTTLKLKNFDVTEIPDLRDRVDFCELAGYSNPTTFINTKITSDEVAAGYTQADYDNWPYRLRLHRSTRDFVMMTFKEFGDTGNQGTDYHNTKYLYADGNEASDAWSPAIDQYGLTHMPETIGGKAFNAEVLDGYMTKWNAANGKQWCYTCRGDADALEALAYWTAQKLEYSFTTYTLTEHPYKNTVTISIEDAASMCDCVHCAMAASEDGGSYQGAIVRLINRVVEIIDEWMEENKEELIAKDIYRPNYHVVYLAYSGCTAPPAVYDEEQGKLVLANENCEFGPKTGVWYCGDLNQTKTYYQSDDENNVARMRFEFFGEHASQIYYYSYPMDAYKNNTFRDSTNFFSNDMMSWMCANGLTSIYNCGYAGVDVATTWYRLISYLNARLSWDATLSSTDLIKQYMKGMFGDGADSMLAAFNMLRFHTANMSDYKAVTGADKYGEKEFWNYNGFWKPYLDLIYKAIDDVSGYAQVDYYEYVLLKQRIEIELITPLYKVLTLISEETTPSVNVETKIKYVDDLRKIMQRVPYVNTDGAGRMGPWIESYS